MIVRIEDQSQRALEFLVDNPTNNQSALDGDLSTIEIADASE